MVFPEVSAILYAMTEQRRKQVGEWIAARREGLGMGVNEFATLVGVETKTINNAESGRFQVATRNRSRYESVLGWKTGSLRAAYKRGVHPELIDETETEKARMERQIRQSSLSERTKDLLLEVLHGMEPPMPRPREVVDNDGVESG